MAAVVALLAPGAASASTASTGAPEQTTPVTDATVSDPTGAGSTSGGSAGSDGVGARIVGGRPASRPYPFVGAVQQPEPSLDGHPWMRCGASLIATSDGSNQPSWMLTTAGCNTVITPGYSQVRVGSLDRTAGGTLAGITAAWRSPDFTGEQPGGDIALIRLDRRVDYPPVALALRTSSPGTATLGVGWGRTCDDWSTTDPTNPGCRIVPTGMHELDSVVLPDTRCAGIYDPAVELCSGAADERVAGTCYGDGGTPTLKLVPTGSLSGDLLVQVGSPSRDGEIDDLVVPSRRFDCSTAPDGTPGATTLTDVSAYLQSWVLPTLHKQDPAAAAEVAQRACRADAYQRIGPGRTVEHTRRVQAATRDCLADLVRRGVPTGSTVHGPALAG